VSRRVRPLTQGTDVEADEGGGGAASWLLRLVFLVAVAFTTIGIIETGFILQDLRTRQFSIYRAPDLGFGIRSWTVHHALRPGYSNPAVHINSFGLRSPEVAVPKPAGTVRILLLGDSFTFGLRVRDEETFGRRLEERLRGAYGAAPVEVVNAGVLSYCPLLEYLQYRHHLHILEPDLVVLNFDMSDVQDHMAYSRDLVLGSDGAPLFVTEPSLRNQAPSAMPKLLFFEWLGRRIQGARGRVESTLQGVPFVRDQDRYLWALDGGGEWDAEARNAMAPILDLSRLLEHNGIPLLLATYPQPWQVSADATSLPPIRDQYGIGKHTVHLNDRPFKKLANFAAEHHIPFVNATSAFREDATPATLFLGYDFHFTPRGHQLYAEVLAASIVDRALIRRPSEAYAR
jgi:lysophospholipase L1-like esterase